MSCVPALACGIIVLAATSGCGHGARPDGTAAPTTSRTTAASAGAQAATAPGGVRAVRRVRTPPETVAIARIVDGATIATRAGTLVRLAQVDAPVGRTECFGERSRAILRTLIPPGTRVGLRRDTVGRRVDRRGRLIRHVYRRGRNINVELVRLGAVAPYIGADAGGLFAADLVRAGRAARRARRGLWRACPRTAFRPDAALRTVGPRPARRRLETRPRQRLAHVTPSCHPSYRGACLDVDAADYDCAGGRGNGPKYTGTVQVVGADVFDLDRDGDGVGCD